MYFTSGQDRAFERLMQEKPGFDHYDGGGATAPEDCGTCRFYRLDWKYQFCVYAECPYQPGKLIDLAAVKFTMKGADEAMAVFRVEKNKGYTVMSNYWFRIGSNALTRLTRFAIIRPLTRMKEMAVCFFGKVRL